MCFICMQLANQLELCLHKQTQIVATAACRVGSQEFHSWIASLPLVSLLFIVIPTPFLNFLNFIYYNGIHELLIPYYNMLMWNLCF